MVERTITRSLWLSTIWVHERLVDLDLVQRQALQRRERGIAGAEVVDRQPQAVLVQAEQVALRGRGVEHHRALGELEREQAGVDPPLAQQRRDDLGQLLVVQACGPRG